MYHSHPYDILIFERFRFPIDIFCHLVYLILIQERRGFLKENNTDCPCCGFGPRGNPIYQSGTGMDLKKFGPFKKEGPPEGGPTPPEAGEPRPPEVLPERQAQGQGRPEPAQKAPGPAPAGPRMEGLSGFGKLLSQSWEVYRRRFQVFMLILLIASIPFVLLAVVGSLSQSISKSNPMVAAPFALLAFISSAAAIIFSIWGQASLVFSITDTGLDLKGVLGKGWRGVLPFFWISVLFLFIALSGFVLFIVPGIVFLVWFSFSFFVFAAEGDRGIHALLKSKEYVRGLWLPVFSRLLGLWAISLVLSWVPMAGPFLSVLFMPFVLAFTYFLYLDLKRVKEKMTFAPSPSDRKSWLIIWALGFVIAILIIALVIKIGPEKLQQLSPDFAPGKKGGTEQIRSIPGPQTGTEQV